MVDGEEKTDDVPVEKKPFFSASSDNSTVSCGSPKEVLGGQIGPYKLLSVLGEGGYGIVYLAEQHEPIRRRVALKIIKPGMDTRQVIARFEAECQALALFDHPNIAHIYNVGTTKTGRPYFVMERVKGMPITEHCDQEKSGIEERLELFLDICDAIQYAHQKGIIHRDIKPSNILVSIESKGAVPKVIDFGVAKAISQPLTERTLYTEQGQFIGTPEYMSPEQAEMTIQDIDTRSDVYSLGVVLYELLTGVLPFDPETLHEAGIDRLRQIIREEEPKSPSTRLSHLGEKAVQIAAKRRTEVGPLANRLHKELDWIPMKAMRKERVRRYRSVSELADDIQNYLDGNPLIAGPELFIYKLKKYTRKRVRFVAAAAIVTMAVLVGLVVSTTMYLRAEDARMTEAEQRKLANVERDRALVAEQQLQKQLAVLYEQRGRSRLASGKFEEAIIFFNEAHQLVPERYSAKFLLSDTMRRWRDSRTGSEKALIPWRVEGMRINPSGYAISPNRDLVALVDSECENVYIFETHAGEFEVQLPAENVERMAFTRDGRHLILRSRPSGKEDYRLQVIKWAADTIVVDRILTDPTACITQLCQDEETYAPDYSQLQTVHNSIYLSRSGRWLAVPDLDIRSRTTNVYLIDVESEKPHRTLTGLPWPALRMAFSPDERAFAMVNWRLGPTYLWDVYTDELKGDTWGYAAVFYDVVSPDAQLGIRVSGYTNPWVILYRGEEQIHRWWNSINAGFSPEGDRFVTEQSGPRDSRTTGKYPPGILWETATGKPIADLGGEQLRNWYFSPDSALLVTEHSDGELRVWNTRNGSLRVVIPPEEGRLVTDVSPDSLWLLTRSGKTSRTAKMWYLKTGAGFELLIDRCLDRDLAKGWLNRQNDRIFQFSHETPTELPRFNANGSKVITAAGLQDVSCQISSPEEAEAWVQANIAIRWDDGYLRTALDDEMLTARIRYSVLTNGPEDPCTVSLRFEMVNRRCQQLISAGNLEEASKVIGDTRSWITPSHTGLYQSVQQILKMLSVGYFKRGERSARCGKYQSALASYEAAVQTDETNADAWRRLAWLQATSPALYVRKGSEAVPNARKACALTEWKDPHCSAALAAAYAAVGNFKEAVRYQEKAFDLLPDQEIPRWQANFEKRLKLYRTSRPYDNSSFLDVPTEHLVAWWRLDERDGNMVADSSGNANHGTLIGDPAWESGIVGGGLLLGGGGIDDFQYVRCGNSPAFNMTDAITVSGWMKVKRFLERHEPIITKGDNSWGLRKWAGTDKMRFDVFVLDEAGSVESRMARVKGRTGVEDGKWHYIVGVYDGERACLYVDGVLDMAIPATGPMRTDDFEVLIGQSSENLLHRQWNGLIDDVRVYERALSREEVIELFYLKDESQNGAPIARAFGPPCLTYPQNIGQVDATVIDDGQPHGRDGLAVDWSLFSGPGSVKFLPSSKIEDPCVVFPKPGAYELLLTASDGEREATDVLRVAVYPEDFDGLLARYTFDDGTAANSSSIDGLHGKLVGNAIVVLDPSRGSVLNLTENSHVDCGSDARFDSIRELTLTAWIKVGAFAKTGQSVIAKRRSWGFSRYKDTDCVDFKCVGVHVPGYQWNNIPGKASIADGSWHHIAGVFDGREMRLYVDGVLDNSIVASNGEINVTKEPVRIGDDSLQSGPPSNVLIDDVRIYNRALGPDEIIKLHDDTQ